MENKINKVICADAADGCKKLSDEFINLIFTSPPYANMKKYVGGYEMVHPDDYPEWFMKFIPEFYRVLAKDGSFLLNIADMSIGGFRHPYVFKLILKILEQSDFKFYDLIIWDKKKFLPNRQRLGSRYEYIFWFCKNKKIKFYIDRMRVKYKENSLKRYKYKIYRTFDRIPKNEKNIDDKKRHVKPSEKGALPSNLIEICSETRKIAENHFAVFPERLPSYFINGLTDENDVVLDPFCGTGTTLVAAKKLNRRYIGFDISKEYCEFSEKRLLEIQDNFFMNAF